MKKSKIGMFGAGLIAFRMSTACLGINDSNEEVDENDGRDYTYENGSEIRSCGENCEIIIPPDMFDTRAVDPKTGVSCNDISAVGNTGAGPNGVFYQGICESMTTYYGSIGADVSEEVGENCISEKFAEYSKLYSEGGINIRGVAADYVLWTKLGQCASERFEEGLREQEIERACGDLNFEQYREDYLKQTAECGYSIS